MIPTIALMLQFAVAPMTYQAYTGTDAKSQPSPPPLLGPANTTHIDPTFGTEILRVTDANTMSGKSFRPTDAGFFRTFNADNTKIKLSGSQGDGYWLEFDPVAFRVGLSPHLIPYTYGEKWQFSVIDPDAIYVLNGAQIAKYILSTGTTSNIGGPSSGAALAYMAVIVGLDNWVCSAAGPGQQDTWTQAFCIQPSNPSNFRYIDITAHTVNGVYQSDPNWPTGSGPNGIHGMAGSTGDHWVEFTLRNPSWGGNGTSVFNLDTNRWQLVKAQCCGGDIYWGGHTSLGNGRYANGAGNQVGNDSRGILLRNADATMDTNQYRFVGQPPAPYNGWCDAEHSSWNNTALNTNAPIFQSRYNINCPNASYAWTNELLGIAVDGSNTVWRFGHNYSSSCYDAQAFAQISNDGRFLLFSSIWGNTLGSGGGFACSYRIDTFMVRLPVNAPPPVLAWGQQPTTTVTGTAFYPAVSASINAAAREATRK